jgi:F0F1-type ATP synthase membrane subunit b/b'
MSLTKKQKQVLKNILAGNVEDIKKELQNIIDELDLRILEETDSCAKDIKFRIKSIISEDYYD